MNKKATKTDLGTPEGDVKRLIITEEHSSVSSLSPQAETKSFTLTLNIGAVRKFSFSYDVTASRKRRANLLANGRTKFVATDWD